MGNTYHLHIKLSNGNLITDPDRTRQLCELKDGDTLKVRANPSDGGFTSNAQITKIEFFTSKANKDSGTVAATYSGSDTTVSVNGSNYEVSPGGNDASVAQIEAKTNPTTDDDAWFMVYITDGSNNYALDPEIVNTSGSDGWRDEG